MIIIWSRLVWESPGMCLKYLLCRRGTLHFFFNKNVVSQIFEHGYFSKNELSSRTQLLGNLFGEISHKSGLYGPYGRCWFSLNSDM